MNVDPNSTDAWFARIEQRLTGQDSVLARIEAQVAKTNGRVTGLESWKESIRGRIAGWTAAAIVVGSVVGWAVESGLRITFSH